MAEQFVLKGVNEIRDYSYTGSTPTFLIKNNPRGGNTWQIPQWWAKKANNVQYVSCTVIEMVGTDYVMIIPTSKDTQIMVSYDDDVYNIGLTNFSSVDRVLIAAKDPKKLVIEYMLPSISAGAIAKRIYQTAATIGDFTITGKGAIDIGQSSQYQANASPDATDEIYAWTVEQSGSAVATSKAEITAGAAASGCTVQWKQAGSYDVKCVITSSSATDSPKSDSRAVTCSVVNTIGTATVSGSATPTVGKGGTYTVAVSGNNVTDLTYDWSVVDATAQISNKTGASTGITFEGAGNASVQCVVSSSSASSVNDQLDVVASKQTIGAITVGGPTNVAFADLSTGKNFTSSNGGGTLVGTTAYQWSYANGAGEVTGAVISTPDAQNTQVVFTRPGTYTLSCKWTNTAADPTSKTGTKVTTVADS
jgi:hypothetical protein